MKKGLLIGGGVLVLAVLVWFGIRHFSGNGEAEETAVSEEEKASGDSENAGSAETGESADVSGNEASADAGDSEDVSGNTIAGAGGLSDVSGDDVPAENAEEAAAEGASGEESSAETASNASDENVLYTLNTSAGSNLGMVPIVNGNAVVMLDGGSGVVYQGNYTPEETDAFSLKMENETAKALSNGKIAEWAFYREEMLQNYTFPEGVTSIEKFAFARSGLTSITIPEGVTSIGFGAFYHCDALSDVTIPDSVTNIDANAFSYTPWLQNWLAGGAEEDGAAEMSDADDFLIVGDGILLAYRGKEENPLLPESVKSVAPGALNAF